MTKQKKVFALWAVLWALIVLTGAAVLAVVSGAGAEYTADCDAVRTDSAVYVSRNTEQGGQLYAIRPDGRVKSVYTTRGRRYIHGRKIACLALPGQEDAERGDFYAVLYRVREEDSQTLFTVAQFNEKARLVALSPEMLAGNGYEITGLSVTEETAYVTAMHGNYKEVTVFTLDTASIVNLSSADSTAKAALTEEPKKASVLRTVHAEGTRSFVDAEYAQKTLFTRTADVQPGDYFSEDTDAKELFDSKRMGFFKALLMADISWAAVLVLIAAGLFVIALAVFVLPQQKRVVYRIAGSVAAAVCAVVLVIGAAAWFLLSYEENLIAAAWKRTLSYEATDGSWATDAASCTATAERLADLAAKPAAGETVADVCLIDPDSGRIAASVSANAWRAADYVYGSRMADLAGRTARTVTLGGRFLFGQRIAVSAGARTSSGTVLAAVYDVPGLWTFLFSGMPLLLLLGLLLFLLLSVLLIRTALAESRDLDALSEALVHLVDEDFEYEKPENVTGRDMRKMWNAVHEIEKRISQISRGRYQIYQAYFRFAPKNIERILKKDSITEVKSGDAIRLMGTLAFVSTEAQKGDDRTQMKRRNAFLQLLEEQREENGGISITQDANLSTMKVLFLEESHTSVRFGTDLLAQMNALDRDMRLRKASVLLHYAPFIYGIAGTETQVSAFLSAPESEQLSSYAQWFREMGLGVVISESVRRRETDIGTLRHIGFVNVEDGAGQKRIELYEVLDADDFAVRQGKLRRLSDFEDALDMFYAKDFYFARNAFTDILREVPQDAVSKWYLFECERLLNEIADDTFAGEMHL